MAITNDSTVGVSSWKIAFFNDIIYTSVCLNVVHSTFLFCTAFVVKFKTLPGIFWHSITSCGFVTPILVIWPTSTMRQVGRSRLVAYFPTLPAHLPNLFGSLFAHQLQLVSTLSSIYFSSSGKVQVLVTLFVFFDFYPMLHQGSKVYN